VTDAEDFKSLRRLALASLGRNVLHFQRLEAQLKLLALFSDLQAPLDQFAANHRKKAEGLRTKTMGKVVNALHQSIYEKPPDLQTTAAIAKASLSVSFRIAVGPGDLRQEKQSLEDLVKERNQLIHHDLAGFNPDSVESCRRWITRLDEQNDRIVIQVKYAQRLVDTCKQAFREIMVALDSEEWRRGFRRQPPVPKTRPRPVAGGGLHPPTPSR